MPTQQIIPARQNSSSSHSASPRSRGTATRLAQQRTSGDAGDLGVSSAASMSRTDSGHISGQQHAHRNDHWQSRLRRPSSEQAQQRVSPTQAASPFASIEAMLSSIPETLSSIPSMPTMASMPSVPSMSDIERSMQSGTAALQSGWSSFTGSLGLSTAAVEPQQQAPANTGWVAFADTPSTAQSSAAPLQPPINAAAQLDPFAELSNMHLGSEPIQAASSIEAPAPHPATPAESTSSASFTMPRRQPTGLQSLDPLNAAKEAASVPLRSMSSAKQPMTPRDSSQHQLSSQQCSADRPLDGSGLMSMTTSPSKNWSDFAVAPCIGQSVISQAEAPQRTTLQAQAATDAWADWKGDATVAPQHQTPSVDQHPTAHLDIQSKQASLLDL